MKTSLYSTLMLLLASVSVLAHEPVMPKNHCHAVKVNIPDGYKDLIYFSPGCDAVFVLPKPKIPAKVTGFRIHKDMSCSSYDAQSETKNQVSEKIERAQEEKDNFLKSMEKKIESASLRDKIALIRKLNDGLDAYDREIGRLKLVHEEMTKKLYALNGAVYKVNLKLDLNEAVESFKKVNPGSTLKFEPLPVKYAELSYVGGADEMHYRFINKVSIPDLPLVEQGFSVDQFNLILKQGVEAEVTMSLASVCHNEEMRDDFQDLLNLWSVNYSMIFSTVDLAGRVTNASVTPFFAPTF